MLRAPLWRCALALLGTAALTSAVAAQGPSADSARSFGVALAITTTQWKDKVLNPARHRGWFPTVEFSYGGQRERSREFVELQLSFSPLASKYDPDRNSLSAGGRISYGRALQLTRTIKGVDVWLGGLFSASADLAYFENWDDSHFYWLTVYSFDAAGSFERRRTSASFFSLEWSVPIVGVASRPRAPILYKVANDTPGAIIDRMHRDMRLTSLHEHRAVDVVLRYSRPHVTLGSSVFLRTEYGSTHLPYSEGVSILRHSIGSTVAW